MTAVKIEALQDFNMTLGELQSAIDSLVDKYGMDSIIYLDGAHGNVSVSVQSVGDDNDLSSA